MLKFILILVSTILAGSEAGTFCKDLQNGQLVSHPTHCNQYFECNKDKIKLYQCPENEAFNPLSLSCDETSVAVCKGNVNSTELTTRALVQAFQSVGEPVNCKLDERCPGEDNARIPVLFRVPFRCDACLRCFGGYSCEINCPKGFQWSFEINECVIAARANCNPCNPGQSGPGACTPDTRCNQCENPCAPAKHLPHESDCNSFYTCSNGYKCLFKCPAGLHWSIRENKCDWPWNAMCDTNAGCNPCTPTDPCRPTDPCNPNTPSNCKDDTRCIGSNEMSPIHLPHELKCEKFYKCSGGKACEMDCPPNLHWSIAYNRCEYPAVAQCDGNIPNNPCVCPPNGGTCRC